MQPAQYLGASVHFTAEPSDDWKQLFEPKLLYCMLNFFNAEAQRHRERDVFVSFQLYEPRNTQNTRKSVWNKKSLFCVFRAFSGFASDLSGRLCVSVLKSKRGV